MSQYPFNCPGKRPENIMQYRAEFRQDSLIVWKWIAILAVIIFLVWFGWAVFHFLGQLVTGPEFFLTPSANPRDAGFGLLLKLIIAGCLLAALVWFLRTRR